MIILGVDPGCNATGLALIEPREGEPSAMWLLGMSTIKGQKAHGDHTKLLNILKAALDKPVMLPVDLLAFEESFVGLNKRSALKTSWLAGLICGLLMPQRIVAISPTEKKPLPEGIERNCRTEHEKDAIAIALAAWEKEGLE